MQQGANPIYLDYPYYWGGVVFFFLFFDKFIVTVNILKQ